MEKKEFIRTSSDKIEEVAKIKKITTRCVQKALSYETNSDLARFIRAWVLENGGTLYRAVPRKEAKVL